MLAKCSRCTQTFQTDRFGEQHCPFCGATVSIATPAGPAPAAPGAEGAQDLPAPFDEPSAHGGTFGAFVKTWRQSLFEPQAFFTRLRVGTDWGGAYGYAAVILLVAGPFVGLNTALQLFLQFRSLGQQSPELASMAHSVTSLGGWFFVGLAVFMPVAGLLNIVVSAGLYHLALMIVGGAKGGFNATLRAVGYSYGPYLFGIVPFCGSTISGLWMLVLLIFALSKLHRISVGRAVGAFAVMLTASCCCCGLPAGGFAGYAMMKAIEATHHHGVKKLELPPMDDLPDNP